MRIAGGGQTASVSTTIFTVLDVVIGSVTFTGSLIASGKLQGLISGKPIIFPGSRILTIVLSEFPGARPISVLLSRNGKV